MTGLQLAGLCFAITCAALGWLVAERQLRMQRRVYRDLVKNAADQLGLAAYDVDQVRAQLAPLELAPAVALIRKVQRALSAAAEDE